MTTTTLAAITLVVCVAGAAFGGYWSFESIHAPATSAVPSFTYTQTARFDYAAHLLPNSLYNTTTLTPGNGTLFTAITQWVNLTFGFALLTDVPVNASLVGVVAVELTTPAWTKTLATLPVSGSVQRGTLLAGLGSYDLNVSLVGSIENTIDRQTDYSPQSFGVDLVASLSEAVQRGVETTGLAFSSGLRLNFTAGEIEPGDLSSVAAGAVIADPASPASSRLPSVAPVALLAICVVGIGIAGSFVYQDVGGRRPEDLETLTRPYREAIVEVGAPPKVSSTVPVRTWTDIVKVADTIGAPILRITREALPGASPEVDFYVVSGATAYRYEHRAPATAPVAVPEPSLPRTGPVAPPRAEVPAPVVPPPSAAGAPAANLESFVLSSYDVRQRLEELPPESRARAEGVELLLRAVELARQNDLDSAWALFAEARRRLSTDPGPTH